MDYFKDNKSNNNITVSLKDILIQKDNNTINKYSSTTIKSSSSKKQSSNTIINLFKSFIESIHQCFL